MIWEWEKQDGCWMNIGSLDFVQKQHCRGFLASLSFGLSDWNGAKKNTLRFVRDILFLFLRSEREAGSGFALWRKAD